MATKPMALGTVWTARAKLFSRDGRLVATCMDTPNAIAYAMLKTPAAFMAQDEFGTIILRTAMEHRMAFSTKGFTAKKANLVVA